MKKILIVLVAGLAALAFAGCGNGRATSEEAVAQLADPWVTMGTLKEAEELAGFTVEIPSSIKTGSDTVYRYCEALKEIEVQLADPAGYLRKAKDDGDISGDYNEYSDVQQVEMEGYTVTIKGNGGDSYNLAVWQNGEYSFCAGFDAGVSLDKMKEIAQTLK